MTGGPPGSADRVQLLGCESLFQNRRPSGPSQDPIELIEIDIEDLRHFDDEIVAADAARLQNIDRRHDVDALGETALGAVID